MPMNNDILIGQDKSASYDIVAWANAWCNTASGQWLQLHAKSNVHGSKLFNIYTVHRQWNWKIQNWKYEELNNKKCSRIPPTIHGINEFRRKIMQCKWIGKYQCRAIKIEYSRSGPWDRARPWQNWVLEVRPMRQGQTSSTAATSRVDRRSADIEFRSTAATSRVELRAVDTECPN